MATPVSSPDTRVTRLPAPFPDALSLSETQLPGEAGKEQVLVPFYT